MNKQFVTYLTIYTGDKLPPFYIGSTTYKKFKNFYHGSVLSKKYKETYQYELKHHPEYFDTCIIEEFDTRKEALDCELYYQKLFSVVENELFFNLSYASPNGFFGRPVKKQDHPLYGSHNCKGNIHSYNPKTNESFFLPYIPKDCIKGRGPEYKGSSHNKGKRWYNNGISQKMYKPGTEPTGWNRGSIITQKQKDNIKLAHANMPKETKAKRALAVSNAQRGPAYKYYDELYSLWMTNGRLSPSKFKLIAIEKGFPDISYHNIIYSKFKVDYENSIHG